MQPLSVFFKTLTLFLLVLIYSTSIHAQVFPGNDWETKDPAELGLDAAKLQNAISYLAEHAGSDSSKELVIVKNGYLLWKGENADHVHSVWSVAKTFTSTILGLLIQDGKCTLETHASEYVTSLDAYYAQVTLEHFANMTSGYRAIGDDPQGGYKHGPSMMPFSPDPYPLFDPGTHFAYWDSAMNQFANVLKHISDTSLDQLFADRIAQPIGIADENWKWGKLPADDGDVVCGAGNHEQLKISSLDLARFGLLFLNNGNWSGEQLVDESWVSQATQVQVPADMPLSGYMEKGPGTYGYNWWINGTGPDGNKKWPDAPLDTYAASGFNNNDLFVIPSWNMVIVRLGLDENESKITDDIYNTFLGMIGKAAS
ncbi:MAG: serine hydrolase [candidate division KSB1 bacterium]|nr:serine hydrolase [candidate division KSB1 bacterium]